MQQKRGTKEYLINLAIRAVLGAAMALPYGARVRLMGWVMSAIVAPLAGWRKRIHDNLALILPDLPAPEVARLQRAVPDNFGRALIESYSGQEFIRRATARPLTGPGVTALDAAHKAGRPVLLVTAHFGNYQAVRVALIAKGYPVGALYMPMTNAYFNAHYTAAIKSLGGPTFERGRRGLAEMVKFLRTGGMVGVVADHHMAHGAAIDFMGHPALTALSSAELALKYGADVIPVYGRRLKDGLGFELIVDRPIPHGDPIVMTRAINASLEPLVRETPEQWFWIHRRWKGAPARGDAAPQSAKPK